MKGLPSFKKVIQVQPNANPNDYLYRFNVENLQQMMELGIFGDTLQVELIEGILYKKMPQGNLHRLILQILLDWCKTHVPQEFAMSCQMPIDCNAVNQLEPDLAILSRSTLNQLRPPHPEQVFCVIEIASTSLILDRTTKLPIYAAAKIPTYWIVNLIDHTVEVYSNPIRGKNPRYRKIETFERGDVITLTLPKSNPIQLPVSDLIPETIESEQ
jgi:hypothetical protein